LYHFPARGLKLHRLEIFPFLCNARIYALRPKKPGFLPNLWTTTTYFRKKPGFIGPYLGSLPLPQEGIKTTSGGNFSFSLQRQNLCTPTKETGFFTESVDYNHIFS
ncbi:hypothetical protein, partial [Microcoleus sp. S13_C3]|uniref:hypothetical protein n=1 Tax=Microcoleus sp. S13_C3 TaxID=3055409 RepID=UPI002FCF028C